MKLFTTLTTLAALTVAFSAQAGDFQSITLKSAAAAIQVSQVDSVITLAKNKNTDSVEKEVKLVVLDSGLSTDMSPRYQIYLTITSYAEMGNISSTFDLGYNFGLISATRLEAGVYKIVTHEFGQQGMGKVTRIIDSNQAFVDEKLARKKCGSDFCDFENLDTSVSVELY